MNNSIYLSSDEILVLASLLGASRVYGIESQLFSHYDMSSNQKIKEIINRLSEKQLLWLDYEGKFHLNHDLYEMMDGMKDPDALLVMQTTEFSGKKETAYYYKKKQYIYRLQKGQHLHALKKVENPLEYAYSPLEINEHLSQGDLQIIQDYLDWFDEDGAMQYLEKNTQQPKIVKMILDDAYDKTEVQYYQWEKQQLVKQQKLTVGLINQHCFEWILKDNEVLIQGGSQHFKNILQMMFRG